MEKTCCPEYLKSTSKNGSELEKGAPIEEIRIESVAEGYVVDAKAERRYVIVCYESAIVNQRPCSPRLVWRIDLRLLPASMFIYLISFIDRSNIVSISQFNELIPDIPYFNSREMQDSSTVTRGTP